MSLAQLHSSTWMHGLKAHATVASTAVYGEHINALWVRSKVLEEYLWDVNWLVEGRSDLQYRGDGTRCACRRE